jgi:hypothetical protein
MVHRIPVRADEQSKEAEIVPLLTPPRTIWIGLIGRQEKSALQSQSSTAARLFHLPRRRDLRGKTKQR